MKSLNTRTRLMKSDVRVQMERGGVSLPVRGLLERSAGRRVRCCLMDGGRSLVAFVCGLLLASLYGGSALFLSKQQLWFCVYVTLAAAVLAAFGMGLSVGVRADVAVLLPSLCSAYGRKFLLFLFASMLLSGPLANTFENTERAAASLLCEYELVANQTQELMQRAATPLFSALDRITEISRNAAAVAGRVQKLADALTDGVRHVARTLRNVLHFLVDIGDVCNQKLGSPYRKCRALFAEARADCVDLLGDFHFLCDIIDRFLPLCSLARAGELFCVVPAFIADHLRRRLAAPAVAAFEQMKRQFDFNLSTSVTFDLDVNSSRSLQEVSQDIMDQVSTELQVFQMLSRLVSYAGLVLLACSYLRAARYRRRYLRELDFDNVYISTQFEEHDHQVTSGGGASVLPITRREAETFITPLSLRLTAKEWRAVLVGVASVLKHLLVGALLMALDFLLFWMLDQVQHQVKSDIVARAPVRVAVAVNGSGYASDIFRDLVASINILQRGNITVISRKCLQEPSPPDPDSCFILGFLLGLALLVSLSGGFVQRCRRLVCASYYPERELAFRFRNTTMMSPAQMRRHSSPRAASPAERIQFLRQQILDQRREEGRILRSAARSHADRGGGGGGGGGRSPFQALLQRLPAAARLSRLLGLPSLSCVSCGEQVRPGGDAAAACDVPACPGLYCRPCFHSLGNACVVCTRPLTSQEDGDDEWDSSDDEFVDLRRPQSQEAGLHGNEPKTCWRTA